ncbi:MAG: DEAD/DEAH box helicase [Pseudomonadales bacterium]|jgi:superfamily II DNA/RNA helicase|nr:DEAD/DEAH box helicase [Pseudomonadales bacterium]
MQNNRRGGFGRRSSRPRRPFFQKRPKVKGPGFFNPEELCSNQGCPKYSQKKAKAQVVRHQFKDFNFTAVIANNLNKNGYSMPTPIQDQAIPQIMVGRDVIGLANTGTGKTAAFLLPLIHKVLVDQNRTQKVLIISPTRELAFQIRNEFEKFANGANLRSILAIGGVNINHQIKQLSKPFDFVIGTPGRVLDLSNKNKLDLSCFSNIVLDEVDQMLDMGFIHDIKKIIAQLSVKRQSLFFSATMNEAANEIAQRFLTSPLTINVRVEETTDNVQQSIVRLEGRSKSEVLNEILTTSKCQKTLVFTRTKHGANKVVKNLMAGGFRVGAIHGNKAQNYRLRMLDMFKNDQIQILVATDVASRGLDIRNITHVINYDLPACKEDYIHRIGRTGRADQKGVAISLVE